MLIDAATYLRIRYITREGRGRNAVYLYCGHGQSLPEFQTSPWAGIPETKVYSWVGNVQYDAKIRTEGVEGGRDVTSHKPCPHTSVIGLDRHFLFVIVKR